MHCNVYFSVSNFLKAISNLFYNIAKLPETIGPHHNFEDILTVHFVIQEDSIFLTLSCKTDFRTLQTNAALCILYNRN